MEFLTRLEEWFAIYVVDSIEAVIFFDVAFWDSTATSRCRSSSCG